jgi:hypothetical protein
MSQEEDGAGGRPALRFRDHCIVLRPVIRISSEFGPPGGTVWLRRFRPSGYELIAGALNLPPPQTFGAAFDSYVLTGTIIPPRQMEEVTEGFWVKSPRSEDVPVPANTTFEVQPGTGFTPGEPVILRGSLRTSRPCCR